MQGYEITERMRALLIDWLVQVHSRFQLLQETLYLTVAILDRFLQVRTVYMESSRCLVSCVFKNLLPLCCRSSRSLAESCSSSV